MIVVKQVSPTDLDVTKLIDALNAYQIGLYGIENCNLEPPDSLVKNEAYMVGAFLKGALIGIGAVKIVDTYGEVKRMFVKDEYRGLSVAKRILQELEAFVSRKNIQRVFLETGNRHDAAIAFYKREGYQQVDSFGNYKPNAVSIYFGKTLAHATVL